MQEPKNRAAPTVRRPIILVVGAAIAVVVLGIVLILPSCGPLGFTPTAPPAAGTKPGELPTNTQSPQTNTPTYLPSDTPTHGATAALLLTVTPNTTITSVFGTLASQASATAKAFDSEATFDAQTATANAKPGVGTTAISKAIDIYDEAGQRIGNGAVRLYAPADMAYNDLSEIRVEIQVNAPQGIEVTLNPQPSNTPVLGTPRPTPSPLSLLDTQFVEVREYMGAGLRGVDFDHFKIVSVPPGGLRHMQTQAINWWKWSISPKNEDAVGVNHLEVYIYLPSKLSDGTPYNQETNTIPFDITVSAPPTSFEKFFDTATGKISAVAGTIAALAGAIGAIYGAYRFLVQRRKSGSK